MSRTGEKLLRKPTFSDCYRRPLVSLLQHHTLRSNIVTSLGHQSIQPANKSYFWDERARRIGPYNAGYHLKLASQPQEPRTKMSEPYILIVDDDADARCILCKIMENLGVPTRQAENGEEALAIIRNS